MSSNRQNIFETVIIVFQFLQIHFPLKQSFWDRPGVLDCAIEGSLADCEQLARFLTAAASHSSDWLLALPVTSCGLRLDDESVRVAVSMHLGINLCEPHVCRGCGSQVDARGLHCFTCKHVPGHTARHQSLSDVVSRAFASAGITAMREPSGLVRGDGKRPDGLTLVPWQSDKPLMWDVTVVHTLADSYVHSVGTAAELAASKKSAKYADLLQSYLFRPTAMETSGSMDSSTATVFTDLGRKIFSVFGEIREASFLFQRISVPVQRFNSVLLCDSCAPSEGFEN